MSDDVKSGIRKAFMNTFGLKEDEFNFDMSPEQVKGWDSLSHMSLVSALEEEFKISFDVDQISGMDTAAKVLEVVGKNVGKRA